LGLFGQNEHPEAAKYVHWEQASRLKEMALEIQQLRSGWGSSNHTVEKFLPCCAEHGQNLPGEPKRAAKLLSELTPA
jgi:hypothetical protein